MAQSPHFRVLTGEVVQAAGDVRAELGAGLLESIYKQCLAQRLREMGHVVRTEVPVPVVYHGAQLEAGFRLDLLVDELVVVEAKAVEILAPVHFAQVLTYLRLARLPVGLLINFNAIPLREGIHRLVNKSPMDDKPQDMPGPPAPR